MNRIVDPRNADKLIQILESEYTRGVRGCFQVLLWCRSALSHADVVQRFQRQYQSYRVPRSNHVNNKLIQSLKIKIETHLQLPEFESRRQRLYEELEHQREAAVAEFHSSLSTAQERSMRCNQSRKRTRSETLVHSWESTREARRQVGDDPID